MCATGSCPFNWTDDHHQEGGTTFVPCCATLLVIIPTGHQSGSQSMMLRECTRHSSRSRPTSSLMASWRVGPSGRPHLSCCSLPLLATTDRRNLQLRHSYPPVVEGSACSALWRYLRCSQAVMLRRRYASREPTAKPDLGPQSRSCRHRRHSDAGGCALRCCCCLCHSARLACTFELCASFPGQTGT